MCVCVCLCLFFSPIYSHISHSPWRRLQRQLCITVLYCFYLTHSLVFFFFGWSMSCSFTQSYIAFHIVFDHYYLFGIVSIHSNGLFVWWARCVRHYGIYTRINIAANDSSNDDGNRRRGRQTYTRFLISLVISSPTQYDAVYAQFLMCLYTKDAKDTVIIRRKKIHFFCLDYILSIF